MTGIQSGILFYFTAGLTLALLVTAVAHLLRIEAVVKTDPRIKFLTMIIITITWPLCIYSTVREIIKENKS